MPKQKHKVGVITAPAGIKGDVWVKSFTRPPEAIFLSDILYDETLAQEFHLNFSYEKKGKMRCQLKQSIDRNQAENWTGTVLYKINDAIAEGLESDNRPMLGAPVFDSLGVHRGKLLAIENFGASDLLEVETANGATILLPFIADYVAWDFTAPQNNCERITLRADAQTFFDL